MSYPYEDYRVNEFILLGKEFQAFKMVSDYYLEVIFDYPGYGRWNGCIPIKTKYQGIDVPRNIDDVTTYALKCYELMHPKNAEKWQAEQRLFWQKRDAEETENVFYSLNNDHCFTEWQCRKCSTKDAQNQQVGGRIKYLKEEGFFIATRQQFCPICRKKQCSDLLLRLPRTKLEITNNDAISAKLDRLVRNTLEERDYCFEEEVRPSDLIIDSKFPIIRTEGGEPAYPDTMAAQRIRDTFQLLTQRAVEIKQIQCMRCVNFGKRGDFCGIKWYYAGTEHWDKAANDKTGCIGCCWYDIKTWKEELMERLHLNMNSYNDLDNEVNLCRRK